MRNPDSLSALWNIAYRRDVSREDRILMSATFDRTWAKLEHLAELVQAIDNFRHPTDTLQEVRDLLVRASSMDIIGVGLHGNSVSTHYWHPIENEEGESRPFNFFIDMVTKGTQAHVELMGVLDQNK